MTTPYGLGPLFLIFGSSFLYLGLLGHTIARTQLSWPGPRTIGTFMIYNSTEGTPLYVPVLRPDWDGISDFFITWAAVLATLVLLFAPGVILHTYILQALATIYFAPNWRPQCV